MKLTWKESKSSDLRALGILNQWHRVLTLKLFQKRAKEESIWNLGLFITQKTKKHEVGKVKHGPFKDVRVSHFSDLSGISINLKEKFIDTIGPIILFYFYCLYYLLLILWPCHCECFRKKKQKILTAAGNELTYRTHLIYVPTIPV